MQPALELQGNPLPPVEGRVGIDRTQGVIGDGQRFGVAHHLSILADDGHVIRQERAGIVIHRAQNGRGLARISPSRDQDSLSIEGHTSCMDQGIAFADERPAQDRFHHVGIQNMQRVSQDWRDSDFHMISLLEMVTSNPYRPRDLS